MKKVTIQDVARELNLSRNTVAKALNNSDTVAYETRYMVIEKACEMGYQKVSPAALNEFKIKNAQTEQKTILVMGRKEVTVFWNSVVIGISDAVNKNGCRLRINFVNEEDEKNLVLPKEFEEGIDGIIMITVFSDAYMDEILKKKLPIVCLDAPEWRDEKVRNVDILLMEGQESVRRITNTLIKQGRKRIGFIGDITYCRTMKERFQGYLTALREAGMEQSEELMAVAHTEGRYYWPQEVERYIDGLAELPDAVVCANDAIAFLVIRTLKARGLRVPEDVAVTGFDNEEELSRGEPFLTTVKVGNQRLGRRLVAQLLFRMQNPDLPRETVVVDSMVIYRESSGK
ncbi:MAG: LacI family DNA-binding transcriptional regulator [Lachnospiraceae bacterium]|nr:LacI family DNA-binding transcriptional regulator [Lachnospiraceae bacterium]